MINLDELSCRLNKLLGYCHECKFNMHHTFCDCGKWNKILQELSEKDPEGYRKCFVETPDSMGSVV